LKIFKGGKRKMPRIRKGKGEKGEEHHRMTVLRVKNVARELGYRIEAIHPQTEHGCDLIVSNPKNQRSCSNFWGLI
jgi:hypothetical protein